MTGFAHRVLAALHARGFHPAVLAGLVMMPAVVAVGFWTGDSPAPSVPQGPADLRGTLVDPEMPSSPVRFRNEEVPKALP